MSAYYNEIEPYAAEWLRNLIKAGHIANGEVDTRSIVDVQPVDLRGFTQCHFFAGIGGWSLAARLAGWADDRPLWTGSCPCQPFSSAGNGKGQADERHLWPEYFRLIRACRPPVVMGEQVAAAVGKSWLDGVCADLEGIDYACGAVVVPACAVNAPHRRDRLWFVANASGGRRGGSGQGQDQQSGRAEAVGAGNGDVEYSQSQRRNGPVRSDEWQEIREVVGTGRWSDGDVAHANLPHGEGGRVSSGVHPQHDHVDGGSLHSFWDGAGWITGADGKARRFEPGIPLLAHGVPARVGRLRAYGNAIVPQVAAEVIAAFMECEP